MGLTGNTSNRDIIFLKAAVPGLEKTEAGNRLIVKVMRRVEELKINAHIELERYIREGGDMSYWPEHLKVWDENQRLLSDDERSQISALTGIKSEYSDGNLTPEQYNNLRQLRELEAGR